MACYLPTCIESIISMNYENYEVILVDDGSTDGSGDICEEYKELSKKIKVVHQKNAGVSSARNTGLAIAQGYYVGFVDPDDWIASDMYSKMINMMESTGAELCCCNWETLHQRNREAGILNTNVLDDGSLLNAESFVIHLFDKPRTVLGAVWNKLFVKAKITEKFDENLRMGEDFLFIVQYCKNIKCVVYTSEAYYNYYLSECGVTRIVVGNMALGLPVRRRVIEEVEAFNPMCIRLAEEDFLDSCLLYYNQLKFTENESLKQLVRREFMNYFSRHFIRIFLNNKISIKMKFIYVKLFWSM